MNWHVESVNNNHRYESKEMFKKLINNPAGLKGQAAIYENYHPQSGVGLNAPHFSWSAAHLLMLFRDEK